MRRKVCKKDPVEKRLFQFTGPSRSASFIALCSLNMDLLNVPRPCIIENALRDAGSA